MSKTLLAHLFGDYVIQTDYMASNKTVSILPAVLHAATYTACFIPATRSKRALAVIGGTHFVIDHWRLARHLCWAKNQLAPTAYRYPWKGNERTGYKAESPDWLATWLMIVADNTVHLAINEAAVLYL